MKTNYGFELKWLAVTSFEMRFGDMTVVTDPYITECVGTDLTYEAVEACDMICLTHAHWDHITDLPRLTEKFQPKILCGEMTSLPLTRWLDYNPAFVYPMSADTELDFDKVKIRALYGRHGNLKRNWGALMEKVKGNSHCKKDPGMAELQEAGSMEYRNWLFTLPNGTRIVLWGSPSSAEHKNACKALRPDILILQRAGEEKGINARVEFAKEVGCKVLIPHHQGFHVDEDPAVIDRFRELFLQEVPDGIFITPKHGEWIKL